MRSKVMETKMTISTKGVSILSNTNKQNHMIRKCHFFRKFLIAGMFMLFAVTLTAQDPPPPPGDPSNGGTNPPVGGSSPVGSGLVILIALGAAYGGRKIYQLRMSRDKQ